MLEDIIPHLSKAKKVGNKWQACCPVHNDRHPSMNLTEKDGKVLIWCHACGASGIDVVQALGLSSGVLFEQPLDGTRVTDYQVKRLEEELQYSRTFINIYDSAINRGEQVSLDDKRKYKMHTAKVIGIQNKLEGTNV